ncbi:hypothetical protein Ddye_004386 [Dipteronia dyeriana]|uniref:Uncharacterized protein n=1 Tax=Dipteronia dyeriana TaxID=168575 RepID=A0AAD9XUN3_9ROSI|nr:hypothetical protein Ddye_004386 [Dipteronia dyeriana]
MTTPLQKPPTLLQNPHNPLMNPPNRGKRIPQIPRTLRIPQIMQITKTPTRADPQPSTQTVDTSESLGETSEEPAPMVDKPPEHRTRPGVQNPPQKPTNCLWFNFEDLAPRQWRRRMSEMASDSSCKQQNDKITQRLS